MFKWLKAFYGIQTIESPRIVSLEDGVMVVQARGCEITISEKHVDKIRRPTTLIFVRSRGDEYLFVDRPPGGMASAGVVKLKGKRKKKEADDEQAHLDNL